MRYKKLVAHVESHASAVSLLESVRRIALYKSNHHHGHHQGTETWRPSTEICFKEHKYKGRVQYQFIIHTFVFSRILFETNLS